MTTISIHSHKGGVGKTTVALLLAKYAASDGRRVCIVDCDFIGAGTANLVAVERTPDRDLDDFLLDSDPYSFDLEQIKTTYTDRDLAPRQFTIISSRGDSPEVLGMTADEPQYREIGTRMPILLDRLSRDGFDLFIIDCHPGLGLVSATMRQLAEVNVVVTTPNRSDCFGLLQRGKDQGLDEPSSFLVVNRGEPSIRDTVTFQDEMESDALIGDLARALFPALEHLGKQARCFSVIPRDELLRTIYLLGPNTFLPPVDVGSERFWFCRKILTIAGADTRHGA